MRLTLRTLLAYLDDILEPTEAREIGAKIAESSYASSLVSKIKDVVRRRRISAPEVTGPGSSPDPNIVAEYLDNTLAPEAVADLERVCLESDAHLAEVAACHQVLTLVRSEPVEIAGGMRERMYALGAMAPAAENNGTDGDYSHIPRVAGIAAVDVPRNTRPSAGEVTLEDRLPEALLPRRRSWLKTLPYIAGAAIIVVWGYLMFHDESLTGVFTTHPDSSATQPSDEVDLSPNTDALANSEMVAAEPALTGSKRLGDSKQGTSIPREAVTAQDLSMTPSATIEEGQPIPASSISADVPITPEIDMPPADAPLVAVAPAPEVMPQPDAFEPPADVPVGKVPLPEPFPVQDASASGILLHYRPAEHGWFTLRPRSAIHPHEHVAAPAPFDATFTVGEGGNLAEIILRGGTQLMSLGSTDGGRFGFEINKGQIIIRRKDAAPADQPLAMQIVARDSKYVIQILEPGTVMGIEVIPLLPTGEGDDRGARRCDGGIAVIAGAASVSVDDQPAVELHPSAGWLTFVTQADAPPADPKPLVSLPSWLNLQDSSASAIVRRYAALYEDEFTTDQPISQSIRPVVKDRRPPLSELATQTLALTGSYPGLVDALGSQHEESRLAAIVGLKSWLPLRPEHAVQLRVELQNRFRGEEAEAILRLLWGYSEQDLRNPLDSEDLLNWMGHDEIAIRELAFFHVHQLTDRRYDYRPNDPAAHRAVALQRWRDYVAEHGALIGN